MESRNQKITDRREIWDFRYTPAEVLAAAKKKVKHHSERREWWESEYTKAEDQLKTKGFEYRKRQGS